MVAEVGRKSLDGKHGIDPRCIRKNRSVENKEVLDFVRFPLGINDGFSFILSHRARGHLMGGKEHVLVIPKSVLLNFGDIFRSRQFRRDRMACINMRRPCFKIEFG